MSKLLMVRLENFNEYTVPDVEIFNPQMPNPGIKYEWIAPGECIAVLFRDEGNTPVRRKCTGIFTHVEHGAIANGTEPVEVIPYKSEIPHLVRPVLNPYNQVQKWNMSEVSIMIGEADNARIKKVFPNTTLEIIFIFE